MLLSFVRYVVVLEQKSDWVHMQERVLAQASELRAKLEHQINTALNLTLGSVVFVTSHPDITQQEFANFARVIIQHAPYVLNLGLAKDNVISHIYPLADNEAALGLRYMDNPEQRVAVLRAIKTKNTVIAGPVNLVQGGRGFISRIPIFLNDTNQSYWGISSIVIKLEPFFDVVGLTEVSSTLSIALRGKDATGAQGEVFYGDPQLFDRQNVILDIPLPTGSWVLAAAPKQGWAVGNERTYKIYIAGVCLSLLVCFLLYSLLCKNIDLKREQVKAEIATEHKSRFFTNMTHELRTPLTAIFGAIKLLGSPAISRENPAWKELLSNAERNSQRLMWIVNDILDLKKIETGKMEYHLTSQLIVDVVNESIDEMAQYAEQFKINLTLMQDCQQSLTINADRIRFVQVISNLLSNAIKHSQPGDSITVYVKQDMDAARIEVADAGPGIESSMLEKIFNEFEQVHHSDTGINKLVASSGLGLSICKQIVCDHGGQIGCYNGLESGAVFFIKMPLVTSQSERE